MSLALPDGLILPDSRIWLLEYPSRPFTMNKVYGEFNYRQRNDLTQEWRQAFWAMAKEQKIPRLERIQVWAWPMLRDRRIQDPGACYPAVKAAVDGLQDAGVIPEDDGRYVSLIAMCPPVQEAPQDALRIAVIEDRIT